jgi:hypothetical protein
LGVRRARVHIGQRAGAVQNACEVDFVSVDSGDLPLSRYRGQSVVVAKAAPSQSALVSTPPPTTSTA